MDDCRIAPRASSSSLADTFPRARTRPPCASCVCRLDSGCKRRELAHEPDLIVLGRHRDLEVARKEQWVRRAQISFIRA